jgi:hypothetical protein
MNAKEASIRRVARSEEMRRAFDFQREGIDLKMHR